MKHDQVLRIGSLNEKKKRKCILSAAKHCLRELPAEAHIDSDRSQLNRVLHGPETAAEVSRRAKEMMDAAGIKPRAVNTILGVEVLVCLPVGFDGDAMAFFSDALAWADEFFQVPILSAIVHFDEAAPHMHIIMLPIVDGKLNGRKVMGDMARIQAMQGDFSASVGSKYGMRRKTAQKRDKAERRAAAMHILDAIVANPALLNGGQVKSLLLDAIAQNLDAFAASAGVVLPKPKAKPSKQTFVGIMTKPQRPKRKQSAIALRAKNPANSYALIALRDFQRTKTLFVDGSYRNLCARVDAERMPTHGRRRFSPSSSSSLAQLTTYGRAQSVMPELTVDKQGWTQ